MEENELQITINRPVQDVFAFTLNPVNTATWIDGIKQEETNEWPVKVGSIYRNESTDGVWNQYELTELHENESFTLQSTEGNYSVQYTFKESGDAQTNFTYHEWVNEGVLDELFTLNHLQKLKEVLEVA